MPAKITASKTSVFLVIQACLRRFQLMDAMRAEMDEKRTRASPGHADARAPPSFQAQADHCW